MTTISSDPIIYFKNLRTNIADCIFEYTREHLENGIDTESLKVLFFKCELVEDYLIPYLEKIVDSDFSDCPIHIDIVGHHEKGEETSGPFNAQCDLWKRFGISSINKTTFSIELKAFNISIQYFFEDYRNLCYKQGLTSIENQPSYNIIFCIGVLPFLLNWRFSVTNLFSKLVKGGSFIFDELLGDYKLLDGNFSSLVSVDDLQSKEGDFKNPQVRSDFLDFMRKYEKIRSKAFFWQPELRLSDNSQLKVILAPTFYKDIEFKLIEGVQNRSILFSDIINKWIKKRELSYFRIGIPKDEESDAYREFKELLTSYAGKPIWNSNVEFKMKLGLYFAKDYRPARMENLNWNYSLVLEKILSIQDNTNKTLKRKALALLFTHDLIIPDFTYHCAINSWDKNRKNYIFPFDLAINRYLIPTRENVDELYKKIVVYLSKKGEVGSLGKFIFHRFKNKFPVAIYLDDLKKKNVKLPEKFTHYFYKKEGNKKEPLIKLIFSFDDKGNVANLEIGVDHELINLYQQVPDKELSGIEKKALFGSDWRKIYFGSIEESDIHQGKQLFKKNLDFTTAGEAWIKHFENPGSGVGQLLKFTGMNISEVPEFIKCIYNVVRFHLYANGEFCEDEIIKYFPSAIIQENIDQIKSLGSLVFYEKRIPEGLSKVKQNIIAERDEILQKLSNGFFLKTGIAGYVNQDYIKQSLKAAVAMIISRNGSHGLGSHVLPNVSNYISTPSSYQLLFKHIQQRFDFIAQVATEFPRWTYNAWFANDLMMRLYMQDLLLDTIAQSYGLSAYTFDRDKLDEELNKQLFNPIDTNSAEFKSLQKENGRVIRLYGFIKEKKLKIKGKEKIGIVSLTMTNSYENAINGVINYDLNDFVVCKFKGDEYLFDERKYNILPQGLQVEIEGELHIDNEGKKILKNCFFIDHKLLIKVRRRSFVKLIISENEFENFDPNIENEWLNHYDLINGKNKKFIQHNESLRSKFFKGKDVYDVGKIYKIKKLFSSGNPPNSKQSILNKVVYGVVQNIEEDSVILLSPNGGFKCELQHPAIGHRLIKMTGIKQGVRVLIKGDIVKEESEKFILKNARLLEMVKINYVIGANPVTEEDDELSRDLSVAIPGGLVGFQAFYTILENVIRNAAKHDWLHLPIEERIGRNLEVKIELEDREDRNYLICKVWTNASNIVPKDDKSKRQYWVDAILDDEDPEDRKFEEVHNLLNHRLNDIFSSPIVEIDEDQRGAIKKNNLGLAEIKISVGFLSHQPIEKMGSANRNEILLGSLGREKKGFIRASAVWESDYGELKPRLGFRFQLLKPKEIIIVSDTLSKGKENYFSIGENIYLTNHAYVDKVDDGVLDYEFCIIVDDCDFNSGRPLSSSEMLLKYIHADANSPDPVLEGYNVIREIEYYPYRLLIASDAVDSPKKVDSPKQLKCKDKYFLGNRIAFIGKDQFEEQYKCIKTPTPNRSKSVTPGEIFKLMIYNWWIYNLFMARTFYYPMLINLEMPDIEKQYDITSGSLQNQKFKSTSIDIEITDKNLLGKACTQFKEDIIDLAYLYFEKVSKGRKRSEDKHELMMFDIKGALKSKKRKEYYSLTEDIVEKWTNITGLKDGLEIAIKSYYRLFLTHYRKPANEIITLPIAYNSLLNIPRKHPFYYHDGIKKCEWYEKLIKEVKSVNNKYIPSLTGNLNDKPSSVNIPREAKIIYSRHEIGKERSNEFYVEALSGSQTLFSTLREYPMMGNNSYALNKLILQLYENPFPKVMIIDERVWNFVASNDYWTRLSDVNLIIPVGLKKGDHYLYQQEEISREGLFELTNVESTSISIEYFNPKNTPGRDKPKYKNDMAKSVKECRISTLVIHLSILEQLFGSFAIVENFKKCESYIDELKRSYISSVIVTSGRGEPELLPAGAKFLPYSNIETFILQSYPEKLLLIQILLKTIKTRKNGN